MIPPKCKDSVAETMSSLNKCSVEHKGLNYFNGAAQRSIVYSTKWLIRSHPCRIERSTWGASFKSELFNEIGTIYISPDCRYEMDDNFYKGL